jgi:hypothetical protein
MRGLKYRIESPNTMQPPVFSSNKIEKENLLDKSEHVI